VKICIISVLLLVSIFSSKIVYASNNNEIITNETKSELVEIKDNELKSIDDYRKAYGSNTYGIVAYILNKVRIYSIPFCFLGIAVSAIYEYVLGIRHMETRDKGFNAMIAIVTIFVICQVLPLIFAIVVKGFRG
jgi:hypothetical protein